MKTRVWITHLSFRALLNILVRYRFKFLDKVIYINSTFLAEIILALLNVFKRKGKYFSKIEGDPITGPKLNLAKIYSKNGRLIIADIFKNVLQARRQIAQELFRYNIIKFYLKSSSRPFLGAFFEFKIGKDINCAVNLAHYIRWLETKSEDKKIVDVLVLTWKDWGEHLKPYIREMGIKVLLIKSEFSARFILMVKIISMYLVTIALILKEYLSTKIIGYDKTVKADAADNGNMLKKDRLFKIFAPYSMSILPFKRNGLPWLWDANIKKERVLILAAPNQDVPYEECEFARLHGMKIYKQIPDVEWITSFKKNKKPHGYLPDWRPSEKYHKILGQLLTDSLAMMRRAVSCFNKETLVQFYYFISAAYRIAYYKDFYLSNDIIVETSSEDSENMFLRSLAMEEIGGIIVSWERSIRFGYSHFIHNKPVHVEFVTGNYSLLQLQEKSNAKHSFKSGWINDCVIKNSQKEVLLIRGSLDLSNKCITIALFDELWGDHMLAKDTVEDFYRKFLMKTLEKPDYRLVIKPKKQMIISEMSDEISNLVKKAETLGRCVVLDSMQHVCTASMASDITVALPSMAVFESILSGTPTLIFNYGRIYTELFYQHDGVDKIIFEDLDELINAIEEFAKGLRPDLGDCSAIMQEIDPFRDGNSGKCVGNYLNWFIEGMDGGMTRDEALNLANRKYASVVNSKVIDKAGFF